MPSLSIERMCSGAAPTSTRRIMPTVRGHHMRSTAIALALVAAPVLASSDKFTEVATRMQVSESSLREGLRTCERNQASMTTCAVYEFHLHDIELNELYGRLVDFQDGRDSKQLVAAQRAWLRFRDLNCSYEASDVVGGTLHSAVEFHCKTTMTKDRIEQFKELLSCTSIRGTCRSRVAK
jgi:uncharacterized protein YecT (DUF1311 family)